MSEYRIITFTQPVTVLTDGVVGNAKSLTIDFAESDPALAESMDGWEVINSQIIPAGETVLITFTLRTKVNVDSLSIDDLEA